MGAQAPSIPLSRLLSTTAFRDVTTLGVGCAPNTGADMTAAIQAALNACAAQSPPVGAYFPGGVYQYSGLINPSVSVLGEENAQTIFQYTTANGTTSRWEWANVSNFVVRNCHWQSVNTTGYVGNEGATLVRLTSCSYFAIEKCILELAGSAALLMRSCVHGLVRENKTLNVWHDSFHHTKGCDDILTIENTVINGGDDAFAVVGYIAEGVRPKNITIAFNRVYGTKYARGIAIVGGQNVIAIGNTLNRVSLAGIMVATDASYNTYGNDNIKVTNNILDGCGMSSSIAPQPGGVYTTQAMAAVLMQASAGQVNSNIDISKNTVRNSANTPIFCASTGGTQDNINITENLVENAWDPYNKNGFSLTTTGATNGAPTLQFNNNPGVGAGMAAWYNPGSGYTQIGWVQSATASSVTLTGNVTVPSGATVIFQGVDVSLVTTAASSNSPVVNFASAGGVFQGLTAYYNNVALGVVQSVAGGAVTLTANVTLPSGATVVFGGSALFGATVSTSATANNGDVALSFASTSGVRANVAGAVGDEKTCISVGMVPSGSASIPAGTVVTGVTGTSVALSQPLTGGISSGTAITFSPMVVMQSQSLTTSAATASGNVLTFNNGSKAIGCAAGQGVTHPNVPAGTYVQAVSSNGTGASVTLSQNVTGPGVANGDSVSFVGTGSFNAGFGISVNGVNNVTVARNRLYSISQYGIYIDGSNNFTIDVDSNIGEDIGCANGFGRFMNVGSFSDARTRLVVRGNYMRLPSNWVRAFDAFINMAAANWQYTEWHENNSVQQNAVASRLNLSTAISPQPTVGASPWTWTNSYLSAVEVSVSGGTVSAISIARNGQTAQATGATSGLFQLKVGDSITLTYSVAPTFTVIPRLGQ